MPLCIEINDKGVLKVNNRTDVDVEIYLNELSEALDVIYSRETQLLYL